MRFLNRQKTEEEVKKQDAEIMAKAEAVEQWKKLFASQIILTSIDNTEEELKEGLFEYQAPAYYRAQGTLSFIRSLKKLIDQPLVDRDILVESQKEKGNE